MKIVTFRLWNGVLNIKYGTALRTKLYTRSTLLNNCSAFQTEFQTAAAKVWYLSQRGKGAKITASYALQFQGHSTWAKMHLPPTHISQSLNNVPFNIAPHATLIQASEYEPSGGPQEKAISRKGTLKWIALQRKKALQKIAFQASICRAVCLFFLWATIK